MFGKGAIVTVVGFMVVFSTFQLKLSGTIVRNTDNFNRQYSESLVRQAAVSSMNYAINWVWQTDTTSGTVNFDFEPVSASVVVSLVGTDTIRIQAYAQMDIFDNDEYAISGNTVQLQDSIVAFFANSQPISRYFWFTEIEGNVYWVTGDTVNGPLHTNDVLRTYGSPVFEGKVTANNGITPDPSSAENQAIYNGGWEIGVNTTIPTDISNLTSAATTGNNGAPYNTVSIYDDVTTFEFLADGRVARTVGSNPPDTVSLGSIAPTGVIYSSEDINVFGTLNGQVTIYSEQDIHIQDDLVYAVDPTTNPSSNDMLGLIANNDVIISDNTANNNDCTIHASIMAMNGSFIAENYETRDVAGELTVVGSLVQYQRGPVATFDWGTENIRTGFTKDYTFDSRLNSSSPPSYPGVAGISLLSWWE